MLYHQDPGTTGINSEVVGETFKMKDAWLYFSRMLSFLYLFGGCLRILSNEVNLDIPCCLGICS